MFVRSRRLLSPALAIGFAVGGAACGSGSSTPSATPVSITALDGLDRPQAKTAASPSTALSAPPSATSSTATPLAVVKIMPLGDSLTQGADPTDATAPQSYRGALAAELRDAGYRVDFVGSDSTPISGGSDADNEGHGGFTIGPDASRFCSTCAPANIADNVEGWLDAAQPDVVLLLAGINDLLPEPTPTASGLVRPVTPAEAGPKLEALVARIRQRAPQATVLVASQPPMSFYAGNPNATAAYEALNRAAEGLNDPAGKVVYVPLHEELALRWDYGEDNLADKLHPSASGAAKIAQVWTASLTPVLDQLQGT